MSAFLSVKVSFGDDMRRFALENNSFVALEETIRRTYDFQGGKLTVKYQDDEKDWVTISSDPELAVAIQLASSNTLRLSVQIDGESKNEAGLSTLYPTLSTVVSTPPPLSPVIQASPIEFRHHFHGDCHNRKCEKHRRKHEMKLEHIHEKALKYGIARFVADVTIPDGTVIMPGTEFVKVWRIRNESVTVWPQDYLFVHKKGDRLSSLECVRLPKDVAPGEEFDISVPMKAPLTVGRYFSVWRLTGPKEKAFGQPFHVKINVYDPQGPIVPLTKEDPWEFQLAELAAMGFTDRFEVERLLRKCRGDVDKVVWKLLKHQHKMKYKGEKCVHKMEKHLLKSECRHGGH